jgi:hypothetical protein
MDEIFGLLSQGKYRDSLSLLLSELRCIGKPPYPRDLFLLYLCNYALLHPFRHPEEKSLNGLRVKQLLLEVRNRRFGVLFPSFLNQSKTQSILELVPGFVEDRKAWSFLDSVKPAGTLGSGSAGDSLSGLAQSQSIDDLIKKDLLSKPTSLTFIDKVALDWQDYHSVYFHFLLLRSLHSPGDLQRALSGVDVKLADQFDVGFAKCLWRNYLLNAFVLSGISSSQGFCDSIISTILISKPWTQKGLTIGQAFQIAEILRKQMEVPALYELYNYLKRPPYLTYKIYMTSGYVDGTSSKVHIDALSSLKKDLIRKRSLLMGRSLPMVNRKTRSSRITVLSSDLGNHAVSYFCSFLFGEYKKYGIELKLVANSAIDAGRESLFAKAASEAYSVLGEDQEVINETITGTNPDLIIDLNGFTKGNCYDSFIFNRSIPVVHYLGGLGSTGGLATHVIVDNILNSDGCLSSHYVEELISLEQWMCYSQSLLDPIDRQALLAERPIALRNKFLVGFFNNTMKVGPETMGVIIDILSNIDNSVLLLGNSSNTKWRLTKFLECIPQRLHKQVMFDDRRISWADHQRRIGMADIAIDSIDHYSGATTTCDAIAMGTPVITTSCNRKTLVQRMSLSALHSAGLHEMIVSKRPSAEDVMTVASRFGNRGELMNYVKNSRLACEADMANQFFNTLKSLI